MRLGKFLFKNIILFFLLSNSMNVNSQTSESFAPTVNIPSSPEAAMIGKFGDIPIGYYTGTADISVPLYNLQEDGIEIPIVLRYHSSGIKVQEEATWVGLGWNLAPEGTIMQEVRGKIDDYDFTTLYNSPDFTAFKNRLSTLPMGSYKKLKQLGLKRYVGCSFDLGDSPPQSNFGDAELLIHYLLQGHVQPDLYTFNVGGYSGKFYINPENQQIVITEKSDSVVIEKIGGTFVITSKNGTKFTFGIREVAYGTNINELNHQGVTRKLTSIVTPKGKTITFNYSSANAVGTQFSQNAILSFRCMNPPGSPYPVQSLQTINEIECLTSIVSSNTSILFNLENREDIESFPNSTVKRLGSIDIKSNSSNKKIKSFTFGYSYFSTGQDYSQKRLKLESVKEIGYDVNQVPDLSMKPYLFGYNTLIPLPAKNSFAIDFWGYYNGQANDKLLPDLKYFEFENAFEFLDIYPNFVLKPFVYNYTGANRYTNNLKVSAGILNKVTYPTGGYTEFVYEPNSFTNQFIPDAAKLAQASKAVICTKNNVVGDYNDYFEVFTPSRSTSLHFINTFAHGFPVTSDNTPHTSIIGNIFNNSKIELKKTKNGITTVIRLWTPSLNPSGVNTLPAFITSGFIIWEEDVWIEYDPGATYSLNVNFPTYTYTYPNNYLAKTYSTMRYYDDTGVDTTVSNQCGLRIAEIKNYTDQGVIRGHKLIKYINEDGTSSGILLNRFQPIEGLESFCNICIPPSNGQILNQSNYFQQKLVSGNDFGTNGGTVIGYSRVEEIEIAGNVANNIGKKVYSYHNFQNLTWRSKPNIQNPLNGKLKSEQYFDKNGADLLLKDYSYVNLSPLIVYDAVMIINHSFGEADFGTGDPYQGENASYKYSFESYPLISYDYKLEKVLNKENIEGNELSYTQNYTYNAQGNVANLSTIYDPNNQSTKTFHYATDNWFGLPFENDMVNAKMTGIPLVTIDSNNGEQISKVETEYVKNASTSNLILPKHIYSKKGDASGVVQEKRITYDLYDNKGNLLQYTLENGTPVSIIWGYDKSLPVAKIQNKAYGEISTALLGPIWTASQPNGTESELLAKLDILRNDPSMSGAMVTTYTYKPLVGVTSITDPKGDKITYHYDNFNRLQYVKDRDGNILSENQYNYRTQN